MLRAKERIMGYYQLNTRMTMRQEGYAKERSGINTKTGGNQEVKVNSLPTYNNAMHQYTQGMTQIISIITGKETWPTGLERDK